MRILGTLILSALPVLWGIDYYAAQRKRADFLESFVEFVIYVREQIRFSGREISEIFSIALREPRFARPIYEELFLAIKNKDSLEKIFKNNKDLLLKKHEISTVCGFLDGLGKNDVLGQIAHADYYKTRLEETAATTKKELASKGRLIISLSILAAAALFVLMI